MNDLKFAFRQLLKRPRFIGVLTAPFTIGAITAFLKGMNTGGALAQIDGCEPLPLAPERRAESRMRVARTTAIVSCFASSPSLTQCAYPTPL